MKLKVSSLYLLILGSLSVLGLREQPFTDLAQKAFCIFQCGNTDYHTFVERQKCKKSCNSYRRNIPVLEIKAGANAEYVCQDFDWPILKIEPGIFIVEHRNQSTDWLEDRVVAITAPHRHYGFKIRQAGWYQWRFTRVFTDGISRPEITEWVKARGSAASVRLRKGLEIWVKCLELHKNLFTHPIAESVAAQIGFRIPEDPECSYNVTCSQDQGTYSEWILINLKKREQKLQPIFENLPLGANFTVSVQPQGPAIREKYGDTTLMKFSTPSTWPLDGNLSKTCVESLVD